MNAFAYVAAVIGALLLGSTALAGTPEGEPEGLIRITSRSVERTYILPGADFSAYKKILIAPSEVRFHKNWLRKMNKSAILQLDQRINGREADQILQEVQSSFDAVWVAAFESAGYEVVTQRGADVLEIVPSVFDFYVNDPGLPRSLPSGTLTLKRGRASLSMHMRDSASGTLLVQTLDRRDSSIRAERTSKARNFHNFGTLFAEWAALTAERLDEFAKASPVPEQLATGEEFPGPMAK